MLIHLFMEIIGKYQFVVEISKDEKTTKGEKE